MDVSQPLFSSTKMMRHIIYSPKVIKGSQTDVGFSDMDSAKSTQKHTTCSAPMLPSYWLTNFWRQSSEVFFLLYSDWRWNQNPHPSKELKVKLLKDGSILKHVNRAYQPFAQDEHKNVVSDQLISRPSEKLHIKVSWVRSWRSRRSSSFVTDTKSGYKLRPIEKIPRYPKSKTLGIDNAILGRIWGAKEETVHRRNARNSTPLRFAKQHNCCQEPGLA